MNLVDCYVTKIISEPYYEYNRWWVDVMYESWGAESKSQLMFDSKEQAESVKIGHHFLA